jgi:hypothetical protein
LASDREITASSKSPTSPFHIALASFGDDANLSIIDSRYAKTPVNSWTDLNSSIDIIDPTDSGLITSNRHDADIQLFSCDSQSLPPPQTLSSFHESRDYSSLRKTCRASLYMPRNEWPPLMGLAARTRGDGIECFTQAFDGSVYRQRYVNQDDIEESASSAAIPMNIEDEELIIDEIEIVLKERDNPLPGKILLGGMSTKLYPPAPLSSDMTMRETSVLHLQNIWSCMSCLLIP